MNEKHIKLIADALNILEVRVKSTIQLLSEGATIPFISRYRKELTGSLDEVQIAAINSMMLRFIELEKRRESILKSVEEQGKLTDELKMKILSVYSMNELEDLYLPYKSKRKTRASAAREKGLEPLAKMIFDQTNFDVDLKAESFINDAVKDSDDAIKGALDIIAEWISEDITSRNALRKLFLNEAVIYSAMVKGKDEEGIKYRDYFDFSEYIKKCPSHRYLAIRRGEEEGFLRVSVAPDADKALDILMRIFVKSRNKSSELVADAVEDAYKRLLGPSIENEIRADARERSDLEAIKVFSENLRQLLLSPPLGQKRVMGIDPGFRTGCKVVCLDAQGNFLQNDTIYPHPPQKDAMSAEIIVSNMVADFKIESIAIGNGTAGRETEEFVKKIKFPHEVKIFMVSESGASIYSASDVAREEFPNEDLTVRGAISIGRRLMDPLAELVKIDPKSIGVGQYQHDVDQNHLKESLDQVVESCVNKVGVNVNTASKHLLLYVSGLGPQLAANIVSYRKENGQFTSRKQLMKVPRMGEKVFEQAAGFLRIPGAKNPLDNSAVHPESYSVVERMAQDLNAGIDDLLKNKELRTKININQYVNQQIGLPTLKDILHELEKPGRDPREQLKSFEFSNDIHSIDDVKVGMLVPGIVTNITRFGAFVDIGVKQDGLVHVSQLTNKFVSDPAEVVKLQQQVMVKVIEVDVPRKRINLSMKNV